MEILNNTTGFTNRAIIAFLTRKNIPRELKKRIKKSFKNIIFDESFKGFNIDDFQNETSIVRKRKDI